MAEKLPPYSGQPAYNTPPPPTHTTVVVQQKPVVVHQTVSSGGGLFSNLERAFDSAAKDVGHAFTNAVSSSIELLKSGNVVCIQSKVSQKRIRVMENGQVDCCGGDSAGPSTHFTVVSSGTCNAIKFRSVSYPSWYLSISGGYLIGYGTGGPDCDFVPSRISDYYITLESLQSPGSHLGALPSGQITAPAQTTKATEVAQFSIVFVRR